MRSVIAPVALSALLVHGANAGHDFVRRHANSARDAGTPPVKEVEMVASAWYTGWHATDFPLSNVSWDKYTQMTYAFGYELCFYGTQNSFLTFLHPASLSTTRQRSP